MSKRINVKMFGLELGTASGWDQLDDEELMFFEFVPAEGVDLPEGDMGVNWLEGELRYYDEEGRVAQRIKLEVKLP